MTKEDAMAKANTEMLRLKSYFPYRKVWSAIHPVTLEVVTSANTTMRQANNYLKKGYEVYTLS